MIQELSASILLFSSSSITLAVAVYNLYETGYIEPVAALAMINMAIIGVAIWLANRLAGGRHRSARRCRAVGQLRFCMAAITIRGLSKTVRRGRNRRRRGRTTSTSTSRTTLRDPARPLRLRQDHDAAPDRRLHRPDTGRSRSTAGCSPRLRRWCRRRRAAWAWCSRTTRSGRTRPCSRTSSSGSSCAGCRRAEARTRSRRRSAWSISPACRPLSERAQRRPAAARRARALARGRAFDPAARRAAVQSRCQAARAHAQRAQGIAAPHRHHLRLCHP